MLIEQIAALEKRENPKVGEPESDSVLVSVEQTQSEDSQVNLKKVSVEILCWLAKKDSEPIVAIAFAFRRSREKAMYFVDQLESRGFVKEIPSTLDFTHWMVTKAGRQFLVDNGLI